MIRQLNEGDLEALFSLRRVGFFQQLDTSDEHLLAFQRRRLVFTYGYFVGSELASVISLYPFTMYVANRGVAMGGLAGVMSAPEHRRKGHVRALVQDAFERLRSSGTAWSLEYPFDPAYYARFGYQSVPNGARLELPCRHLLQGAPPEAERITDGDLERLTPIYEAFAKTYNFTLSRDGVAREAWLRLLKERWETRERSVYLLEDAYCIFDFSYGQGGEPSRLKVHDYAYQSAQGRASLLRFWGSFDGQADVLSVHLPGDDPLLFDHTRALKPMKTVLQARVVDVKTALEDLGGSRDARFVLEVNDDVCSWNNAAFEVTLEARAITAEPVSNMPDLSLDVRTLALLLSGGLSATAAARYGLVKGDVAAAEALAELSGGHTPFMPNADFF